MPIIKKFLDENDLVINKNISSSRTPENYNNSSYDNNIVYCDE